MSEVLRSDDFEVREASRRDDEIGRPPTTNLSCFDYF